MTRRELLGGLAGALVWLCGTRANAGLSWPAPIPGNDDGLVGKIRSLVSDVASAQSVGARCLVECPEVAMGAIGRVRDLSDVRVAESPARFRDKFVEQRRRDFLRGDTIVLDGWVLARCEADVCAALVLLESNG